MGDFPSNGSIGESIREGSAVSVYIKQDDLPVADALIDAVAEVYSENGIRMVAFGPIRRGSWFQQFKLKFVQVKNSKEAKRLLAKSELAIQAATIDEPQSRANVNNSIAVANLVTALQCIDEGVVLAGSVLLVKYSGESGKSHLQSKTLSPSELLWLERNQNILTSPEQAVNFISSTTELPMGSAHSAEDDSPQA